MTDRGDNGLTAPEKDDNELMELAKQGDKAAYEALVVRHYDAGVAFACQIVRDYHLSEDIVQECFAKIYLLRGRYRPAFTFKTYLFTVIRNRAIDCVRKQKPLGILVQLVLWGYSLWLWTDHGLYPIKYGANMFLRHTVVGEYEIYFNALNEIAINRISYAAGALLLVVAATRLRKRWNLSGPNNR